MTTESVSNITTLDIDESVPNYTFFRLRFRPPILVLGPGGGDTIFDSLELGLGSYLLENIKISYPISIIPSNNNIEFIGNSRYLYLDKNGNPLTYFIDNKLVNFYYGTVQLKVTGEFQQINGYYIYDELNDRISFNNFPISFNPVNTLGSNLNNYLNYWLYIDNWLGILNMNKFLLEGNKNNGINIKGYSKKSKKKNEVNSYILVYVDFDKYTSLLISCNSIPNYFPQLDNNNFIIGKWIDNFYSDGTPFFDLNGLEADTLNYGIDQQSYGYKLFNFYEYGKPFKIPSEPEYVNEKKLPVSNYLNQTQGIIEESFWYKNDKYWKDLMSDKSYENIFLNDVEILTPLGTIGVMINGISVYNHLDYYDDITEEIIQDQNSLTVNRILNKNNTNISFYNKVNIQNFDNHGGTIDRNHNYNYNKYPVGLEAMIKLGTYNSYFIDEDTPINIEEKVFYQNGDTKGLYYLNISNSNFFSIFSDNNKLNILAFKFELLEIPDSTYNYTDSNIEIINIGKPSLNYPYNASILINILNLPESEEIKYNLVISQDENLQFVKVLTFNREKNSDNEANNIYYLKYIEEDGDTEQDIVFYLPKQFEDPSFQYKGYLNKINSEVESENEIMLYMKTMLDLATEFPTNKTYIDNFHSPLLGWAFDGFPIYGQIGYNIDNTNKIVGLKLLKSSYNTDYQYVQGSGDLDFCNGIFCPTPEFPSGIYHYVCTLCVNDSNENEITFKTYTDGKKSLYAYPYIIGAYKGIPEISNFDFEKTNSYFINNYSNDSITEFTYSTSSNNQDVNSLSSNKFNNNSSLVISNQTNYEINLRSLKSNSDKYNGKETKTINISQDENYIELQQGSKPYIWNFTDSGVQNEYFGKTNNTYGYKLNNLIGNNEEYLKAYGTVKRFKYLEEPDLGNTVIYDISNNNIYVKKTDDNKPILGILINIDVNNKLCYVCTDGICEIKNISGNFYENDLLKSNNDGSISKYDNNIDTGDIYIIGNYMGISNNRYLININPKTLIIDQNT